MSFFKDKLKELRDMPNEGSSPLGFVKDAIKKTAKVVEHGRQEVIGALSYLSSIGTTLISLFHRPG